MESKHVLHSHMTNESILHLHIYNLLTAMTSYVSLFRLTLFYFLCTYGVLAKFCR